MKSGFPSLATISGLALGFLGVSLLLGPESFIGAGSISLAGVGALMLSTIAWSGDPSIRHARPSPLRPS